VTMSLKTRTFELRHSFHDHRLLGSNVWYAEHKGELKPKYLYREGATTVTVLPKPPKIQIVLHGLRTQYYVGEQLRLQVEILNNETNVVNGSIAQKTLADDGAEMTSRWITSGSSEDHATTEANVTTSLDAIAPSASQMFDLLLDAPSNSVTYSLTIDVDYTLASEQFTPLKKTLVVELPYVALFDVKFNFGPLLHTAPWPSYFNADIDIAESEPSGIVQLWRLGCQVTSLAGEDILVKHAEIEEDRTDNETIFKTIDVKRDAEQQVAAHAKFDRSFEVQTQKLSLDDRRPIGLDLSLAISWSRSKDSVTFTTKLPMPRLTIPSSEPRALCTVSQSQDLGVDTILQYHLENPSTHFLTFAVTMGASEDFAFSGPKHRALSLAPLSRHRIEYHLMVHDSVEEVTQSDVTGRWLWPALSVVDSYYQKTLRVQAAGPGVKADAQRGLGVWVQSAVG